MSIPTATDAALEEAASWTAFLPSGVTLVVAVLVLAFLHYRLSGGGHGLKARAQTTLIGLSVLALLVVLLLLPAEARQDSLTLLGVVLSAAVAFSSTTFLGNLMAGLMQRAVKSFEIGDFVQVEGSFGRVSELGLFHTEIQTEDRDLTTLPNLFLATHPVQVVRSSGTVIGATVSIGYDEPHTRIRELLSEAAGSTGLEEPFTQILELGDYAVTYRAAGVLRDVKAIVSSRSKLRAAMLDTLHGAGVEIVSPEFRILRTARNGEPVVAPVVVAPSVTGQEQAGIEAVVFDKAEEAASIEDLRKRLDEVVAERKEAQAGLKAATDDGERARLEKQIERLDRTLVRLETHVRERASKAEEDD